MSVLCYMWLPLTKLKNYDTIEMHNTSCVHGFVMTELQRIRVDFAIIKRQKKPNKSPFIEPRMPLVWNRNDCKVLEWKHLVMKVLEWKHFWWKNEIHGFWWNHCSQDLTAVFKMFNGAKIQTVQNAWNFRYRPI